LNPQGSSLGRFRDGCHRRLACPSVPAAAAGIEPAIVSLTGSRLTIGPHRKTVRTVGFEPTLSGSRNRRIPRLSYVLPFRAATVRERGRRPLPYGRGSVCEAPSGNRTRTSCMASRQAAVTSQVPVGSERLELSPRWLRARYAAANTWIPVRLGPLSYEPLGPEGVEPSPNRLKGGYAAITPRPRRSRGRIGFKG
jgi:hypothetical protein